jgi:hypothetical protein
MAVTCPLCSTGITPLHHYYRAVVPTFPRRSPPRLIPNLFRRLLAEGALNSAYVPISMCIGADNGAVAAGI